MLPLLGITSGQSFVRSHHQTGRIILHSSLCSMHPYFIFEFLATKCSCNELERTQIVEKMKIMIHSRFFPTPMMPPNLVRRVTGVICQSVAVCSTTLSNKTTKSVLRLDQSIKFDFIPSYTCWVPPRLFNSDFPAFIVYAILVTVLRKDLSIVPLLFMTYWWPILSIYQYCLCAIKCIYGIRDLRHWY